MSLLGETAELSVLLKLKDEITGPLKGVERQLTSLDNRAGTVSGGISKIGAGMGLAATRIAIGAAAAGTAVAGIAVAATKSAMDFQASMELIATQAGGTQSEVDAMTKGILAMTTQVGTSAEQLAAGLYHIESAGLRGAKALDILKVAAEGAQVGHANLESVTNALVASVNSGIKGTTDMTQAMGVLNAIVGAGNMRMQDLADAFSTGILSSAKTFGISIQSVGAAIADLTNQGVPAADAATRLRMTISLLGAPTSKAAKELEGIGLSSTALANAMRGPQGILGAVQLLKQHLDASGLSATQQAALLSNAFGGGRSSSAIMTLVGSVGKLNDIQNQVTAGTSKFGDAWAKTQEDVDFKAAQLAVTLDKLKLQLGEALLPAAGNILDALSTELSRPEVTRGITSFGNAIAAAFSPANIHAAMDFADKLLPEIASGAGVVLGIAKQGFDLFNALPAELKTVAIAALIGNKLTGGLVASGIGDVARGLLRGVGGKTGVVGSVLGGIGVQHVWVDNMGPGMGGGLPDLATTAGRGGLVSFLTSGAGLATIAAAAVAILAADAYLTQNNRGPAGGPPTPENKNTYSPSQSGLQIQTRNPAFINQQRSFYKQAVSVDSLSGKAIDDMTNATKSGVQGGFLGKFRDDMTLAVTHGTRPIVDTLLHSNLFRKAAEARQATGMAYSGQVLSAFLAGNKGVTDTQAYVTGQAISLAEINALRTPGNDTADMRSANYQLGHLVSLQERFQRQGDTVMAAKIGADISSLRAAVDRVRDAVNAQAAAIAAAVAGAGISPGLRGRNAGTLSAPAGTHVNVNVGLSGRDVQTVTTTRSTYSATVVRGNRAAPGAAAGI